MARFIAVSSKSSVSEDDFKKAFDRTGKWRYAKRGWIVKAYLSADESKLFIESEAPEQSLFEDWLSSNGWQPDEVHRVGSIYEAGLTWPMTA